MGTTFHQPIVVVCPWVRYWAYYPYKVAVTVNTASRLKFYALCTVVKVKYSGFV